MKPAPRPADMPPGLKRACDEFARIARKRRVAAIQAGPAEVEQPWWTRD